jgi:hypothetical protein
MKKFGIIIPLILVAMLVSCATTGGTTADDKAIASGVTAWNEKEPAAAAAFWTDIRDKETSVKYLNYITLYNAGASALADSDTIKSSDEKKLLAACNTAVEKFSAIDPVLKLPPDICQKGSTLAAGRISAMLVMGKVTPARDLQTSAVKVYGNSDELSLAGKEIDIVSSILTKKAALNNQAGKARAIDGFDDKIAAFDATLSAYSAAENEIGSSMNKSGVTKNAGAAANLRSLKKAHQDLSIERESAIRARAYEYKDRIGEEFARTPEKGKNGSMSLEEILAHQESVKTNIDKIYNELLTFASRYPDAIGQDILNDINDQRKDLEDKIAQVNKEISTAKEIASRGKVVMPIMIGLFNPQPGSTAESKKSRPAKFSATNANKDEYWWGMVSIPRNQMNDLVITLKDNRTVRVFPENTKSGKLIKKNNLKDLVNRGYKVGNSWPVLNAGSQLTSDKYFFEVQKGKTENYEGEVVVYSSFVVRMR